jgi:hypothetical protein
MAVRCGVLTVVLLKIYVLLDIILCHRVNSSNILKNLSAIIFRAKLDPGDESTVILQNVRKY